MSTDIGQEVRELIASFYEEQFEKAIEMVLEQLREKLAQNLAQMRGEPDRRQKAAGEEAYQVFVSSRPPKPATVKKRTRNVAVRTHEGTRLLGPSED